MFKLIRRWPRVSFILIGKVMSMVGYAYFLWLVNMHLGFWHTLGLVAIYSIITAPIGYFLTYSLGGDNGRDNTER